MVIGLRRAGAMGLFLVLFGARPSREAFFAAIPGSAYLIPD